MNVTLVRHGQTEWSLDGRHTSRTQLPLTQVGEDQARAVRDALAERSFSLVLSSPMDRAVETAELAGIDPSSVERTDDLLEWDYGEYEGVTTAAIRETSPGWTLWTDGCPGGESAADVGARLDRVIERIRGQQGDVLVFGHGHSLRVLTARWLGLAPEEGRCFRLDTATLSTLGYEREIPVLLEWNLREGEEA